MLAVDVLANAIRANPHTTKMGAATLAERYLRALHAAGYVIKSATMMRRALRQKNAS